MTIQSSIRTTKKPSDNTAIYGYKTGTTVLLVSTIKSIYFFTYFFSIFDKNWRFV